MAAAAFLPWRLRLRLLLLLLLLLWAGPVWPDSKVRARWNLAQLDGDRREGALWLRGRAKKDAFIEQGDGD